MNHTYKRVGINCNAPPPEWHLNDAINKFEEGVLKNTFLYYEEGVLL